MNSSTRLQVTRSKISSLIASGWTPEQQFLDTPNEEDLPAPTIVGCQPCREWRPSELFWT